MTEQRPDDSYHLYGADALLKRIQALVQETDGVRQAEDIEFIHRMRVASRRLRSAFGLFAPCLPAKRAAEWEKQIKRITRALGAARDVDVQIDFLEGFAKSLTNDQHRPGIERLILRLRQQRQGLQDDVLAALDRFTASRTADEMGQVLRQMVVQSRLRDVPMQSPYLLEQAYLAISLKLEELLSYDQAVRHPQRVTELHAARIVAKHLRYTMEIFAPVCRGELKEPLQAVRQVQEMLGDIHDSDVWSDNLPIFLDAERTRTVEYFGHARTMARVTPGIHHLQQEVRRRRGARYQEFLAYWQQVQKARLWEELRQTLRAQWQDAEKGAACAAEA